MNVKTVTALAALLVGVALALIPTSADAQGTECTGVDLVILVDNSTTMITNNDVASARIDAARAVIDGLGDDILWECPNVIHRLAVVGFGDRSNGAVDTTVYLRDGTIAPDLDDFAAWRAQRQDYRSALPKPPEAQGGTDYLSAFQAAQQVFADWDAQPIDESPRYRGLILLSDGSPCVFDLGCGNPNRMAWGAYMAQLQEYLDPQGQNFPWQGSGNPRSINMWFIVFNNTAGGSYNFLDPNVSSYGDQLLAYWQAIIEGHGGEIFRLRGIGQNDFNTNRDIGQFTADIVDSLTGAEPLTVGCEGPFFVDPYFGRMNIRIQKLGSNPDVAFEDVQVRLVYDGPKVPGTFEDGRSAEYPSKIIDYIADGPNERYIIQEPPPGTWRVEVEGADICNDLKVQILPYPILGSLVKPRTTQSLPQYDTEPFYNSEDPEIFEYMLSKSTTISETANPIASIPEFPLSVKVEIVSPNKSVQTMDLVQGSDGVWRSTESIKTPEIGQYTWRLLTSAPKGDGSGDQPIVMANDSVLAGSFNVKAVDRFHIEIVEPVPQSRLALNRTRNGELEIEPVTVAARIVNEVTGQPLTEDQIAAAGTPGSLLYAAVSAGGKESESIPLTYDAAAGHWQANLTAGENGIPAIPGNHAITVSLNRDAYNKELYRPAQQGGSSATVNVFRRLQLDGEIIGPAANKPVPEFDEGSYVDPDAPIFLEYSLLGWGEDAASPLELKRYPVELQATVRSADGAVQEFELSPLEGAIWRGNEPIQLPVPGEYTWTISATVPLPQFSGLIPNIQQSGVFSVSQVGRFHLEIVEPKANETYPINRYSSGAQDLVPLTVAVRLVDDASGNPITPAQLGDIRASTGILSVTVESMGQTSNLEPLVFDDSTNLWTATLLADATTNMPQNTGEHAVRTHLNRAGYDTVQYRLSSNAASQEEVRFNRIKVEPVLLEAESQDVTQAAYAGATLCLNASSVPLAVRVRAVSQPGGASLDPERIAADNAANLFRVLLVDPVTNAVLEEGSLALVKTAEGADLVATVGVTQTAAGNYAIRIVPNPAALTRAYEFLDAGKDIVISVNRTYNPLYDPANCERTGYGLLVLFGLIVLWMIVNFLRRPVGLLEVIDTQGGMRTVILERNLGRSLLLLFRTHEVIKVNDVDIEKLVVRRGSSDEVVESDPFAESNEPSGVKKGKRRAIQVRVLDHDNNLVVEPTLMSGTDQEPISGNLELRYS